MSPFHGSTLELGGTFEMVQLWVNLPREYKMTPPKYQGIQRKDIPVVEVGEHSTIRIFAGECQGVIGPASTFTVINMYDISGAQPDSLKIDLGEGTNTILLILNGEVVHENQTYPTHSILIFDRSGTELAFTTSENFKGLLLNGDPIDEPIVAHGPFVMNTREEILQAMVDYQNGKMGSL